MSGWPPYFVGSYWKHGFSPAKALTALLSSFGALWLLVEITSYFAPAAVKTIQEYWWAFPVFGVAGALWKNRPRHEVGCRLTGRDIVVQIFVGDLFSRAGAFVVGSNTSFDTDTTNGMISPKSIQGQFTTKFYDSVAHLDTDIQASVKEVASALAPAEKRGKGMLFPMGTVAQVCAKKRTAYLVAIAGLSNDGIAHGTFNDLKTALPRLWEYISQSGTIEPIVIPVLGSGFSRIPEPREEIIREIINSFVAACSERRFTESLTIVIHPRDFYNQSVDLPELGRYLAHVCKYSESGKSARQGGGTPIP
jgi:hypothetical protein